MNRKRIPRSRGKMRDELGEDKAPGAPLGRPRRVGERSGILNLDHIPGEPADSFEEENRPAGK